MKSHSTTINTNTYLFDCFIHKNLLLAFLLSFLVLLFRIAFWFFFYLLNFNFLVNVVFNLDMSITMEQKLIKLPFIHELQQYLIKILDYKLPFIEFSTFESTIKHNIFINFVHMNTWLIILALIIDSVLYIFAKNTILSLASKNIIIISFISNTIIISFSNNNVRLKMISIR